MYDVILTDADNCVGRQVFNDLTSHGLSVYCYPKSILDGNHAEKALRLGAKMVIPVFYPEKMTAYAAKYPEVLVPVDKVENLESLDNKIKACALAKELCIPQPRLYESFDSIESYPVVFKRAGGHGGDSVYFPKNRTTLDHLASSSNSGSYLVQEFISSGREVSVDAIRWGSFFFAAAYEVILPKTKGSSILRRSIDAPELIAYTKALLDRVDYRGVCGLDFMDGKFLECNPRFSGGIGSQIASGFDVPYLLYRLALGLSVETPSFRPGVLTRSRTLSSNYLHTRLRQKKLSPKDLFLCLLLPVHRTDQDR